MDEEKIKKENHFFKKGTWERHEDLLLIRLIDVFGMKNWKRFSEYLPRSGRQCRERWVQSLNPGLNHSPWDTLEDEFIICINKEFGNNWVICSAFLQGRSPNAVKNHWNSTLKKILYKYSYLELDINLSYMLSSDSENEEK